MIGYIHSFQSMGGADGPGVRCVLFLQGCPLRCCYCHNPDTWEFGKGTVVTPEELLPKILRYRSYFGEKGGVTLSGGEPLAQADFVAELFTLLKEQGIHTALDTSGHGSRQAIEKVLPVTDLVLCDVKFAAEEEYKTHCGGSLDQVKEFLDLAQQYSVPVWVRHVVVPGLTDREDSLQKITAIARACKTLEKIELLPFKNLCREKYDALGMSFPLADTPQCSVETLEQLSEKIKEWTL
ncbi:MAG: pyruvate formate lyase-activating protein [Clostridia bacterium]|nr:pyruvate formate lyase-activating protein [Clostridia bacterium]